MSGNKNIFCATNPARIDEALWKVISESGVDFADMLIFLPSRRAVRTVEKMIAMRAGGVAFMPNLVALGEGADDESDEVTADDVISNTERVVLLAQLLAADATVGSLANALEVAHDLVRIQDYLENEGVDAAGINWTGLVDKKYATHFQNKAAIFGILSVAMAQYAGRRITSAAARNRDIRLWKKYLDKYKLVVVCASTASVPATADLMVEIAKRENGRIILSGKISGREQDFQLNTNPYNAEYKFLLRLGLRADDVVPIDVGASAIDFMNYAFGNDCAPSDVDRNLSHCHLVEVPREAIEAESVAEIAERAVSQDKSVLVITPDAAGNQRIGAALKARGIVADFSGGVPGTMSDVGRAILNLMDDWIEKSSTCYEKIYNDAGKNLFATIDKIVADFLPEMAPSFQTDDEKNIQIWVALRDMSDALEKAGVQLNLTDARAFVADCLSGVTIREKFDDNNEKKVVVLGTVESRMQTADVVILTGLNDGMFPACGYENAWLPQKLAQEIGLPSPDRKVSLQALDFMNLSCGKCVYWIRSLQSGGVKTSESRFLSRVIARMGQFHKDKDIVNAVLARDDVPSRPLDYSVPVPPADWSDVYVTELEHLIHNPYSFYVRHILRLYVKDDYWAGVDTRDFGNLVHKVVEQAKILTPDVLVAQMDKLALEKLGQGSVIFHFWHKRFVEIAPVIIKELLFEGDGWSEIRGVVKIAGRNVRARADRVWDGGVMDIKTGQVPNKSQLQKGNMPQLPLEAYILSQGGFPIPITQKSKTPIMRFLQLQNNHPKVVPFNEEETKKYIDAAIQKVTELFNMYSAGGAGYEYHETGDQKYKAYDDLARIND